MTEIGEGETALTNARQIVSTCNGTTSVAEFPDSIGAIVVRIPCSCKMLINNADTVRPEFPCIKANEVGNVSFTVHLPSNWLKLSMSNISDVEHNLQSIIPSIDPEWPFRIATINITPPVLAHVERVRLSQRMATYEDSSFLIYAWMTLLSLVVAVLALKFVADMGLQYMRSGYMPAGMGMIPGAVAVTPGDVGNFFVDKVTEIELGGGILVILWVIVGIVAFCIGLKILRGVNRISRTIDHYAQEEEDVEASRFRRSNSRRR